MDDVSSLRSIVCFGDKGRLSILSVIDLQSLHILRPTSRL